MKKSLLVLLLILFGIGTQAQENVDFSKKKDIISPEINADNTVTFRLDAKNAKEVKVQGDCIPEGGILTKGEDGIWSLTTKKLNPELYSYSFFVDGVKAFDPNNAFLIRDVSTVVNVFLVETYCLVVVCALKRKFDGFFTRRPFCAVCPLACHYSETLLFWPRSVKLHPVYLSLRPSSAESQIRLLTG